MYIIQEMSELLQIKLPNLNLIMIIILTNVLYRLYNKIENGSQINGGFTMESKNQYKTRQLKELISYLETIPQRHVTVNDIRDFFKSNGKSIGTATIYRHLERMTEEGLIRKYIIDETSSACYEYIGEKKACHKSSCFHCKCKICGRLIHIQSNELLNISELLKTRHNFTVDLQQTVFYGICDVCSRQAAL